MSDASYGRPECQDYPVRALWTGAAVYNSETYWFDRVIGCGYDRTNTQFLVVYGTGDVFAYDPEATVPVPLDPGAADEWNAAVTAALEGCGQ